MSEYHVPVLLKPSIDALVLNPDGFYADATFGGGGHSREILSRLSALGRLMAFDRDADALSQAPADDRFILIHNNFRFIHNYTLLHAAEGLDGILADLGVSSHQFDTADRGFSFRYNAPLDMRMNVQGGKTAADIVNSYTQEELENIFRLYGELDNARRVSQLVVSARTAAPILTTDDLDRAIAAALPSFAQHKYLAKVYQALRIEVNAEMRSLEKFLSAPGRHHLPLPRRQDGQELHPLRQCPRHRGEGRLRARLRPAPRRHPQARAARRNGDRRQHPRPQRQTQNRRESMKTWKIADIGLFFKNSFVAMLKGEFLLRLNVGRYFIHIAYTFLLFGLIIWMSLMIETTMSKVEKNKAVLKELEIVHSQKVFEVVGVSRRASVEQMLGEMGSKVKEAEKPATTVRK